MVLIIADDMAWDDCSAYGHPRIRTPNLQRLADEGMRFDNAFLTCSSCSPSRASILTGRYPHATGAAELHQSVPADQVAFTEALRTAGYWTAACGKWHLGAPMKSRFDLVRDGGEPAGYGHWLPTLRNRPKDRPFFLWLATIDPHRAYQPNTIPEPHTAADAVVPPYLPDVSETREDLALYYDEIGRLDDHVAQVLAELEAQGVADNTLVLFISDNGRPFPRCKTTVHDSGVKTPFVVRWPAGVAPGATCQSLVSSVDIAPTLVELAGAGEAPTFQGRSFARLLAHPESGVRHFAFSEHNWHDYQAHKRSVRDARFRYIWNARPDLPGTPPADAVRGPTHQAMQRLRDADHLSPAQRSVFVAPRPSEELYDLRADPHELDNLAGDPGYAADLNRLRAALQRWRIETGDFVPENLTPDRFDRESGRQLSPPR